MERLKRRVCRRKLAQIVPYLLFFCWSWAFPCAATISHTTFPDTIKVAITGVTTKDKWERLKSDAKKAGEILEYQVITVDFQDYVKSVTAQEWNRKNNEDEAEDFLKTGAIAVKIKAWQRINFPSNKGRHALNGSQPDVVDNTADQLYIPASCNGEVDNLCKGLVSNRIVSQASDLAVENTWDTTLKRHDCFYLYGTSPFEKMCPDVFETNYQAFKTDCINAGLFSSHSCIPQNDDEESGEHAARGLIVVDKKTYINVLTTYYDKLSLYQQKEVKKNDAVEVLSTCMMILNQLTDDPETALYRCKKSNRDATKIVKMHYPIGSKNRKECVQESDPKKNPCPNGELYIGIGMQGIVLDTATKDIRTGVTTQDQTWFKIQWKVKPGSNASDNQSESENVIVGWSPDRDIKPADAMSLVEVKIIGARLKAPV